MKIQCVFAKMVANIFSIFFKYYFLSHGIYFSCFLLAETSGDQFALWVAFFEIYNECVYDLLQLSQSKKRSSLRVCDDGAGNAYVKGVKNVNTNATFDFLQ